MCSIEIDIQNAHIAACYEWEQTREQAADFAKLMLGERITEWHRFRWPRNLHGWIWAKAPERLWPAKHLLFNPNGDEGNPALRHEAW